MMDMKNFVVSKPETEEEKFLADTVGALILRDAEGREWYSSQQLFSADTYKVMYDKNGIVRSITRDVSTLFPASHSVAEVIELPNGVDINGGWVYQNEMVSERLLSDSEIIAAANTEKLRLRAIADPEISWRQDAVDAGIATEGETSALAAWKQYRVFVMRIDTSTAPDIDWPEMPA
jgi:hypothetical protein